MKKCVHLSANLIDRASVRSSVIQSGFEYSFVKSLQGLLSINFDNVGLLVFLVDLTEVPISEISNLADFLRNFTTTNCIVHFFSYASHVELEIFNLAKSLNLNIEARSAFFKKITNRLQSITDTKQ